MCTQQQSFKIKEKTDRNERGDGQLHNYNWRVQNSALSNQYNSRQKIGQNIDKLKNIINQLYLIDTAELFTQQQQNTHTFQIHRYTKIDHILEHKTNITNLK